MNDIPAEIPIEYRQVAFFMQVRMIGRDICAFGKEQPWHCNRYLLKNMCDLLADRDTNPPGFTYTAVRALNGRVDAVRSRDFALSTHAKFTAIRKLPLPIADEIWTHFDPVFV